MARSRAEGLSFPKVNSNTPTLGSLTCTVALSDVHIGALKKPRNSQLPWLLGNLTNQQ